MAGSGEWADDRPFWSAAERATKFFMGESDVHKALRKLAEVLDTEHIPYAMAGAMALNEYGYERVTKDVDVLLTRDDLARLKAAVLGRGYVEKFAGSKGIRDTENRIDIDATTCPGRSSRTGRTPLTATQRTPARAFACRSH